MPDHAGTLKSMLQSIINDRHEEASVTMHDYFVAKTKEVAGFDQPQSIEVDEVDADTDFDESE